MRTTIIAVWGTWAVLTLAGLVFVATFGRDCPLWDEWGMLPALAGDESALSWTFQAHSEHRYPLPRLAYLALFRLFGDLRAGMFVSAILLSMSAAGLIVAARRVRGRSTFADLFFPLAFLNGGHWENLLMSYQLAFTIPTALGVLLLVLASRRKAETGPGPHAADATLSRIGLVALVSILLTGCGAAGLCFAVAGAGWLGVMCPSLMRDKSWRKVAVASTGALTVLAAIGLTIATFPHTNAGNPFAKPIDLVRFAIRLVAVSFGPSTDGLWPVKAAVVSLAGGIGLLVAYRGWKTGGCIRTAGLGAVLLGTMALIAGLILGRAWAGPEAAAASRYSSLLLPGLGATFLIAIASGTHIGRVVSAVFAALAVAAWPTNASLGLEQGTRLATLADALATDLRDGAPVELINERYDWQLFLKSSYIPTAFEIATRLRLQTFRETGTPRLMRSSPLPSTLDTRIIPLPASSSPFAVRICGEFSPRVNTLADLRVRWQDGSSGAWHEQRVQMPKCFPFAAVIRVTEEARAIEIVPEGGSSDYRVTSVELIADQAPTHRFATSAGSR